MFSQLWHVGRSSHVSMTNGAAPVAPSIDPQYWLASTASIATPNGWQKPSPQRTIAKPRGKERTTMRDDLKPGNKFPDIALPNHDKETVTLSSLVRGFPTVLVFSRGYF